MSVSSTKLTVPKRINLTLDAIAQVTALALIYVVLIFILPASRETMHAYKFSTIEYRIIDLAVNIPSILVWFAAFMGYATLKHYAKSLEGSEEAASYKKLAIGFGWLAWSLPATALISIIVSSISYKVNGFKPASIIITNYINLLLPLIAFTIISTASRSIASKAKLKISLAAARINILLYLTAAVFYCYFTFMRFNLHYLSSTKNLFYLPVWLMIITIIIPYLYAWFIGIFASYELTLYSKQIGGLLYRRALRLLVIGLLIIVISSIVLQYVNGIVPRVGHLVLNYKLVVTVLFRLINGIGYIILALGAFRLKKIEEV
jgi:hypothetical protein